MEDLGSLGLRLVKNTPRIGTSHRGLRKFGSEVGQEYLPPGLELIMEDLGSLGLRLVKNTSQDWNFP